MSYVIGYFRDKFKKDLYKTTIFFLVMRGAMDFLLWIFLKPTRPFRESWAYIWLGLFLIVLLFEVAMMLSDAHGVRKYFRIKLEQGISDARFGAQTKFSNSTEKELLFTIADGLHQGQSLRKINKHLKQESDNYFSVALKKRRNTDDYKLGLYKHSPKGGITSTWIQFTKDLAKLKKIAEDKIDNDLAKYLENGRGHKLLTSVLYAFAWKSLDDINNQLKNFPEVFHSDRSIQVNAIYISEDWEDRFELQLLDNGNVANSLEIYRSGFVS